MILLDSHTVLWTLTDDPRLGVQARRTMSSEGACVSAITYAEFQRRSLTGSLRLPADLHQLVATQGLGSLPFTAAHAEGLAAFASLTGNDWFDPMLLAQAHVEGLRFLTADQSLLRLPHTWILDATQ